MSRPYCNQIEVSGLCSYPDLVVRIGRSSLAIDRQFILGLFRIKVDSLYIIPLAIKLTTWMLRSAKTLMHFYYSNRRAYILNLNKFMKVQIIRFVMLCCICLFVNIELKYDVVFGVVFETGLVLRWK